MADLSRRDLLRSAGLTFMAAMLPVGVSSLMTEPVQQGQLLFTAGIVTTGPDKKEQPLAYQMDLTTGRIRAVKMSFLPHSLVPYPGNHDRVVAMEKWGQHAAVIDFARQEVVHELRSDKDRTFFGHGFFSASGDTIYMTQGNYATGNGHIVGLNAKNMDMVVDHSIAGGAHDCRLGPNGTFLVASSGLRLQEQWKYSKDRGDAGETIAEPALVQLDLKDGKELNRYSLADASMVHFTMSPGGVIATAAPIKGTTKWSAHIYVRTLEKGWRNVRVPDDLHKKLSGELLSMAVDESDSVLAVTNPTTSSVVLVDVKTASVMAHVPLKRGASGIVYDAKQKAFISSGPGGLSLIALDGTQKLANSDRRFHAHSTLA